MTLSIFVVAVVGTLHLYFFLLESYCYTTALGRKIFKLNDDTIKYSKLWAFNQGYYNLGIGLGLIVSLYLHDQSLTLYLLLFVVMVGIVGAVTFSKKIFWLQAFPALLALTSILFSGIQS